jgi:protein-S-isoprenylcysteine O-methyltransferase Ste14
MTTSIETAVARAPATGLFRITYRAFGYVGLMSIFGSLLYGFRSSVAAPWSSYGWNAALYGAFVIPHLIMTRSWYKRWVYGNPAGTPRERRVYVSITLLTWWAVLVFALTAPGTALTLPPIVGFVGTLLFLLAFLLFFQGIGFEMLDGLLGVPGTEASFSHENATPLFTEGAYANVRHPMYRAALLAGLSSLLIHPTLAQLFWVLAIGGTFIAFIPVEEAQLIRARGEDYLAYKRRTPWRLFRGIW